MIPKLAWGDTLNRQSPDVTRGTDIGSAASKMVKPAARRRVVEFWVREGLLSQRHGCRLMGVSRSMVRYVPLPTNDADLRTRLKALAEQYPRYGCPTLHAMLR